MENHHAIPMLLRTVNHLFLWAIYTMAMLSNQRVYVFRYPFCYSVSMPPFPCLSQGILQNFFGFGLYEPCRTPGPALRVAFLGVSWSRTPKSDQLERDQDVICEMWEPADVHHGVANVSQEMSSVKHNISPEICSEKSKIVLLKLLKKTMLYTLCVKTTMF